MCGARQFNRFARVVSVVVIMDFIDEYALRLKSCRRRTNKNENQHDCSHGKMEFAMVHNGSDAPLQRIDNLHVIQYNSSVPIVPFPAILVSHLCDSLQHKWNFPNSDSFAGVFLLNRRVPSTGLVQCNPTVRRPVTDFLYSKPHRLY